MTLDFSVWIDTRGCLSADAVAALRSVLAQPADVRQVVCLGEAATLEELSAELDFFAVEWVALDRTTNAAVRLGELLAATSASWLVWLTASGVLRDGALAALEAATREFDLDLIYADSVLFDGTAVRRPSFSPVRLREQDYLGDLRAMRVDAIRSVGGFRAGLGSAHPLDLALRIATDAARVLRIPEPLTRSQSARIAGSEFSRLAVADRLAELGIAARVSVVPDAPLEVRYAIVGEPLVSIIVPTRGSRAVIHGSERTLVVDALRGIVERSTYQALEFIVVTDDDVTERTVDELREVAGDRLQLVRWSAPFNFSAKMNLGAVHASGDYLVLLNDDVDVIAPDWIEAMLGLAQQHGIGLVGALLLFEDGTVQHGGHLYADSWAGHIAIDWDQQRDDPLGSMRVVREVSGVTAACAMVSSDTFWEVGGLSTDYSGNYNDVDFSLKIRSTGRSILWTPHARLFHFESKSRVATIRPEELETLRAHWGTMLLSDPYWR
jgi:GT2 family glycosyltransferase